jgi:hypothetical protein
MMGNLGVIGRAWLSIALDVAFAFVGYRFAG